MTSGTGKSQAAKARPLFWCSLDCKVDGETNCSLATLPYNLAASGLCCLQALGALVQWPPREMSTGPSMRSFVPAGWSPSSGQVQQLGWFPVPGTPVWCHRLPVGNDGRSPPEEGGRAVRAGRRLCRRRTGKNPGSSRRRGF